MIANWQDLDKEIRRYAAVCGVDLAKRHEVDACLRQHHDGWAERQGAGVPAGPAGPAHQAGGGDVGAWILAAAAGSAFPATASV
jgi:hypothetical protein